MEELCSRSSTTLSQNGGLVRAPLLRTYLKVVEAPLQGLSQHVVVDRLVCWLMTLL